MVGTPGERMGPAGTRNKRAPSESWNNGLGRLGSGSFLAKASGELDFGETKIEGRGTTAVENELIKSGIFAVWNRH